MELKIKDLQLPSKIEFNFDELKAELTEKTHVYETMVYTDDQIKEAKSDRAKLNSLKKAINDERIRREKEYMMPFNEFKAQVNEILTIIDKPIAVIDSQVKEYENIKKAEKENALMGLWDSKTHPDYLSFDRIFNPKWLNATYTLKQAESDMDAVLEKNGNDVKTIESLTEFSFEAMEEYKRTLDLSHAIAEGQRLADIQKRKEEIKAKEEPKVVEPIETPVAPVELPFESEEEVKKSWIGFKALLSKEDAIALATFLKSRNITFEKLEV